MANILIIDDDKLVCQAISNVVQQMGHESTFVLTLEDGLKAARSGSFDIIFLDVRLPDGSGLDLLSELQQTSSSPEVIIITGYGDPDGAELAIERGAWSYIQKPLSVKEIRLPLLRALQYREEKTARKPVSLDLKGIIGNSPKLRACIDLLAQASNSHANVLITGETGTGKELFAAAVHNNSSRRNRNFVVVDCAALPETLVESVLFGHRKGAFTGADRAQDGLIKQADEGTLFLDEVCELPLSIQKSFLRVLQERRFRPVGGSKEVNSDFRLISATNRNVDSTVKKGTFRQDLLFRLRTLVIELPPLREMKEDIKDLALHYTVRLSKRYGTDTKGFSPEFWDVLYKYHWPGNIRELIQALEKAIASAKHEPTLFPKHLPKHIRVQVVRSLVSKESEREKAETESIDQKEGLPKLQDTRASAIAEVERRYLTELMSITGGKIKAATRISGLSRSRLYTLLKKYDISPSR